MLAEQDILEKVRSWEQAAPREDEAPQPKYVNAIQSSALARWCLSRGENIPIRKLSAAKQRPLVCLVDRILAAKAADPSTDTRQLEEEIDWLVYDLYGLTNEETAVVTDFFWNGSQSEEEEDQALLRAMEEGDINDRVSLEEVLEILRTPDDG